MEDLSVVRELMQGSYFYESTSVKSSRKSKSCALCSKTIPVGSTVIGAKLFNSEFYQVDFCEDCLENHKEELSLMRKGELDDY
jgi:hypothetical protein